MKKCLLIIYNPRAGIRNKYKFEQALSVLTKHFELIIEELDLLEDGMFDWSSFPIVVAAGGDGTVNAVAQKIVASDRKLGVLPLGTFNHFAKHMNIPLDPVSAAKVLVAGKVVETDVGRINDRYFLNFVFFGIYTSIIEKREALQSMGAYKWFAHIKASFGAIIENEKLELFLEYGKKNFKKNISMLFIGNNRYEFTGFDFLKKKISFQADNLLLGLVPYMSRTRLLLLTMLPWFGKLSAKSRLDIIGLSKIELNTRKDYIKVGIDGEIIKMSNYLSIESVPRALKVLSQEMLDSGEHQK